MRLATWRPVRPLPHAAFAAFERDDIPVRAYLVWQAEVGWILAVSLTMGGEREIDRLTIAPADAAEPPIGDALFSWLDAVAEAATR